MKSEELRYVAEVIRLISTNGDGSFNTNVVDQPTLYRLIRRNIRPDLTTKQYRALIRRIVTDTPGYKKFDMDDELRSELNRRIQQLGKARWFVVPNTTLTQVRRIPSANALTRKSSATSKVHSIHKRGVAVSALGTTTGVTIAAYRDATARFPVNQPTLPISTPPTQNDHVPNLGELNRTPTQNDYVPNLGELNQTPADGGFGKFNTSDLALDALLLPMSQKVSSPNHHNRRKTPNGASPFNDGTLSQNLDNNQSFDTQQSNPGPNNNNPGPNNNNPGPNNNNPGPHNNNPPSFRPRNSYPPRENQNCEPNARQNTVSLGETSDNKMPLEDQNNASPNIRLSTEFAQGDDHVDNEEVNKTIREYVENRGFTDDVLEEIVDHVSQLNFKEPDEINITAEPCPLTMAHVLMSSTCEDLHDELRKALPLAGPKEISKEFVINQFAVIESTLPRDEMKCDPDDVGFFGLRLPIATNGSCYGNARCIELLKADPQFVTWTKVPGKELAKLTYELGWFADPGLSREPVRLRYTRARFFPYNSDKPIYMDGVLQNVVSEFPGLATWFWPSAEQPKDGDFYMDIVAVLAKSQGTFDMQSV